jgi:hypothetical protein
MDPRKAALKEFLDFSRNSLANHINTSVNGGKMRKEEGDAYINTFEERSNLILDRMDQELQKQDGGALPAMPKLNTSKMNLGALTSPEKIKQDIDDLMNFDPAEHIAPSIEPVLDNTIWIFVPNIRATIKKIIGTVFLLGSIEKLPIFGPLIASSMDVATAFMPALATTFQNMLPNIIGLAPIPYAAFIGEAAGYVFSSVLMFTTLMTQVSRGEFMEALESAAGMLPVVGTTLMTYVNKGKKVYDKAMEMREKIVISLAQIKGFAMYMLPLVSKKAAAILTKILPILTTVIKTASQYLLKPANFILDNLKPVLAAAKTRLNSLKKTGGGRYTKKTRRLKRKHRKSKTRHSKK